MKVNDSVFANALATIMENYRNDKVKYPWDAKNTDEARGKELDFQFYLNTIAAINSLDRYANKFNNVELDEWVIPSIFSPLIMPSRVTVDNADDAVNLIDRTSEHLSDVKKIDGVVTSPQTLSHEEFMKVNHALRRIFRKDESTWFVNIKELREPVLLSAVLDRAAHNEYTPNYTCMPLNLQIKFYESESYVYESLNVSKRYMKAHIAKELGGSQKSN